MTTDPLTKLLEPVRAVLFDFDGPICSVFDGYPATQITHELLELAYQLRGELEPALEQLSSPHDLLLATAGDPELASELEVALQKAELTAIETARPTPGAAESIAACVGSGRIVAVVSNNYAEAVAEYLARAGISEQVTHIEGRNAANPTLMKPSPHLIDEALSVLGIGPTASVFIGDQTTDIEAGREAGVTTIGFANKPGKAEALQSAGADVVLDSMLDLAAAIH